MLRCMGCMNEIDAQQTVCPHCGYARGTPPREAYHLAPETVLQGRYIVGRVLGYGGFGVTYLGYDAALERAVAIKEFLPSTFATRIPGDTSVTVYEGNATTQFTAGLTRFVEEAQTLAQFNGVAGIVDIYDSFASNQTAYIVMQCLRGQDVKAVLSASGPLPYETAREIILTVCDTLTAVHAKGIIHRDISPDNIYITNENEIKLLDFGAARYESAVNSKSLSVILKSGYAPEEQYRSRGEQGPWTDVYALAATFYKMITGVTPPDSMERAIEDAIKEPSKLGAQLPQSAENAILNALCVRKNQRTQTAAEFKAALLADGVERIKVKKARAGVARVPIAARIAIGASVCLLLGLGIFGASGGFDKPEIMLGGTKLEDTYGTADKEGFVTLPQLAGKTDAEARTLLEELGLSCEVEKFIFSETVLDTLVVAEQEPTAGKQVEEGSTVKLTVNAGDFLAATESGLVPSIIGSSVMKVETFKRNTQFSDKCYFRTDYVYSEEENRGKLVSITKDTTDSEYTAYIGWIGVGPNNAQKPLGALRLAYYDGSSLVGVVASGGALEKSDGTYDYSMTTTHHLMVSTDSGATWREPLAGTQDWTAQGYKNLTENGEEEPDAFSMEIGKELAMFSPELAGQDLALRLERRIQDTGAIVDGITLNTSLRFQISDEAPPRIDSVERVPASEIKTLYEDGRFGGNAYSVENYLNNPEDNTGFIVYRIKGAFDTQANGSFYAYIIGRNSSRTEYLHCTKEGELLLQWYDHSIENEAAPRALLQKNTGSNYEIDAEGNSFLTSNLATEFTLP